jgi:DNA-binding SARP family transcriptional activator
VFAILVVYLNQVVSIDRLIDELWGQAPPSAATASLQAYVSNLRRVLEPGRKPRAPAAVLVSEPPGYALRVPPDRLDAVRFERLAAEGRSALVAGEAGTALAILAAALDRRRPDCTSFGSAPRRTTWRVAWLSANMPAPVPRSKV